MTAGNLQGQPLSESPLDLRNYVLEIPDNKWQRWWMEVGERVNPIVVKEVRQSLKSREFTLSFGLTLFFAVVWTLIYIAFSVPRIYYLPSGSPLLMGYLLILCFPLLIVVPFSAFRSLSVERDDSTFELLSISGLSAHQIVLGKMASACLQIALFASALAPCILLTYLLRGVDLWSILFMLALTLLGSVTTTAVGLTLASVARYRIVQLAVSIVFLAGLLMMFVFFLAFALDEFTFSTVGTGTAWLYLFAWATILSVTVMTGLRAGAAAIDFPAENHSTPIRLRLFLTVMILTFWGLLSYAAWDEPAMIGVGIVVLTIAFALIGAVSAGELGVISPRVRRGLPKTFLGRMFLTWLYPGAGMGYVFLVCLFGAMVATFAVADLYYRDLQVEAWGERAIITIGIVCTAYLAFYVGVTRLFMLLLPRRIPHRKVYSTLLFAVLVSAFHVLPLLADFYFNGYSRPLYGTVHAFNFVWTLHEVVGTPQAGMKGALTLLFAGALIVFVANLCLSSRDVMVVRAATPSHLAQKEQASAKQAPEVDPFAV